jgi:hypothetical protein
MVILRICVATSSISFGGGEGGIWLDGFPGLNPGVAVSRTPSADATVRFTLGNIRDWGRCMGRASRVAEKCWAQFAVSFWPSFC